jgi:hypothetical protein
MQTINVNKGELIEKIRANRDEHRSMFIKAQERYREAMIAELDRALQDARDGKKIRRAFSLPVPEDHTQEFDTAIEMLEWEKATEVKITQQDFQRYVQNRWEWAASFAANTGSYLVESDDED